jgi:AcrR family transcriptional regulator
MVRRRLPPSERRAGILLAARRLVAEKGFAQTSVGDIVRAVGVAQGTFYYHFSSKEEVLNAVAESIVAEATNRLVSEAAAPGLSAVQKLGRMGEVFSAYIYRNGGFMAHFHDPKNRRLHDLLNPEAAREMVPVLCRVIEQGIAEGSFDTRHPQEAAGFILASSQTITEHWVHDQAEPLDRRLSALLDFVLKGLGYRPGRKNPIAKTAGG